MRPLARLCALWLTTLSAQYAYAALPETPAATPPPTRIIVGFANTPHSLPGPAGATGSRYSGDGYRVAQDAHGQAQRVAARYGLRELASWPIQALAMHCVVYEIINGRPAAEVLASLSKDSRVVLAQPMQEFHTLTGAPATSAPPYNDPLYDLQTNLVALGIARAHERTQGAGVRIALIDTGVDSAHPDLRGQIAHTSSFITAPARQPAELRHGTAMAGVIAAVANNHLGIVGVAPLARLEVFEACWQLRAASDAAACNTFTLAQALAGALAAGTPLVNLSLAGPADPLLTALIESGLKRGVIFVAAATPEAGFPGSIPGVLRAAGSEQPLPAGAFAAPSVHVLTTLPNAQYDFESGTSVACAELTGVIALLMSAAHGHLSGATLATLLAPHEQDSSAVDVNAALSRLDTQDAGARLSAR
jgi:subtilisin family serine protease